MVLIHSSGTYQVKYGYIHSTEALLKIEAVNSKQ